MLRSRTLIASWDRIEGNGTNEPHGMKKLLCILIRTLVIPVHVLLETHLTEICAFHSMESHL